MKTIYCANPFDEHPSGPAEAVARMSLLNRLIHEVQQLLDDHALSADDLKWVKKYFETTWGVPASGAVVPSDELTNDVKESFFWFVNNCIQGHPEAARTADNLKAWLYEEAPLDAKTAATCLGAFHYCLPVVVYKEEEIAALHGIDLALARLAMVSAANVEFLA